MMWFPPLERPDLGKDRSGCLASWAQLQPQPLARRGSRAGKLPGEVGSVQGLEAGGQNLAEGMRKGPGRPGSPTAGWKPGQLSAKGCRVWPCAGPTTGGSNVGCTGADLEGTHEDHSSRLFLWGCEERRVCTALGPHRTSMCCRLKEEWTQQVGLPGAWHGARSQQSLVGREGRKEGGEEPMMPQASCVAMIYIWEGHGGFCSESRLGLSAFLGRALEMSSLPIVLSLRGRVEDSDGTSRPAAPPFQGTRGSPA